MIIYRPSPVSPFAIYDQYQSFLRPPSLLYLSVFIYAFSVLAGKSDKKNYLFYKKYLCANSFQVLACAQVLRAIELASTQDKAFTTTIVYETCMHVPFDSVLCLHRRKTGNKF